MKGPSVCKHTSDEDPRRYYATLKLYINLKEQMA